MAASVKKSMSSKKRKLGDLSVDEFMAGDLDTSGTESDHSATKSKKKKTPSKKQIPSKQKTPSKKQTPSKQQSSSKQQSKMKQNTNSGKKSQGVVSKHQASLDRLAKQDPEFYEFLKDEDESLLKFGELSGSDVSDSSDDDDSTSKSDNADEEKPDDDDDNEDEDEDISDFESSSEDEISQDKIMKFLEKKNKEEIAKKKAELEEFDKAKAKAAEKNKKVVDSDKKNVVEKNKGNKKTAEKKTDHNAEAKDIVEKINSVDDSDDDDNENDDHQEEENEEDAGEQEEENEDDFDMDESDSDEDGILHQPDMELEEMSNSDDDDDDDDGQPKKKGGRISVTVKMVKNWTRRFKTTPSPTLIKEAVGAFKAAVLHTSGETVSTKYKVEGAKVYNAVVRMCLVEVPGALQKILNLPARTDLQKPVLPTSKDQKWKVVRSDVKSYLTDVLQLLTGLSQSGMIDVLLKHIHKLVVFYACYPKVAKIMLKKVIHQWSAGEETSRVLAFLCVNRIIRINPEAMLENCVKQLYIAYVRNCKFTSPNTLPLINFMQRSFVEVLSLDYDLAYQYAFIYIRQLAIHLRNAITTKKKESCQAVYNWQFIHCLSLWCRVLCATYPNEVMQPLIYPLVQVIIGTIKLVPTQRYYPLRFHCCATLTQLSKATKTFVPVLPFLLEVFEQTDFNKRHKNLSMKPFHFACILKLSKAQIQEKEFKDGLIDQLYELLLEHFNAHAHSIGFPELVLPAMLQLKDFLKKCKVGNFTKQVRQIVDKVEENSKYIVARRRTVNISLADDKAIDQWERECETAGPPLHKFHATWRKLRDRELMHKIAARDTVVDTELPTIKRQQKASTDEKKEFSALFDDDSEEEQDLTDRFLPPAEKKKLQKAKAAAASKTAKQTGNVDVNDDDEDDYSDFDSDELEQLAGSADDDDDENDDGDDDDGDEGAVDDDSDDDDVKEEAADAGDDGDDDIPEGEDIVKDFSMSSDEED
ncbi:nucleolar complex protein 2 homolog [Dreissena polymorpha]|uniref:nucleolar complex protein 2 homolog n=1 Tax=Dreissena polymorpha TaxID=45954 RepID=UPI00226530B2|nr:nucleolar complex protein 2 homolog [Dreissena polymorpha]